MTDSRRGALSLAVAVLALIGTGFMIHANADHLAMWKGVLAALAGGLLAPAVVAVGRRVKVSPKARDAFFALAAVVAVVAASATDGSSQPWALALIDAVFGFTAGLFVVLYFHWRKEGRTTN
jgi:general stress protein CsbA